MPDIGNLATALATFQGRIGAIPRSKTVKVTSAKTGKSYSFEYAPHEAIIAAIQKPLAECGLAVSQQLATLRDGLPALRTILLHSSGERLDDVFPLPTAEGMTSQELGSTITYIRRYALSAILGLATEDDDDANRAAGNEATFSRHDARVDGLIGTAEKQAKVTTDWVVRQSPDGPFLGFRLKDGSASGVICQAVGELAEEIFDHEDLLVGQRVQAWGHYVTVTKPYPYNAYRLTRLSGPNGLELPLVKDAPSLPLGLVPEAEVELDGLVAG